MDPNYILELIVAMSCLTNLVSAAKNPGGPLKGWIVIVIAILAITAGLYFIRPDVAGYVGGGLWLLFLLLPSLLQRRGVQLFVRQDYRAASWWARAACLFHPLDGWTWQPALYAACDLAEEGSIARAVEMLARFKSAPPRTRRAAMLQRFRIENRWDDLIQWVRQQGEARLLRDGAVVPLYCRALGEVGQLDAMLDAFAYSQPFLEAASMSLPRRLARLMIFAFCGDGRETAAILFGSKSLAVPPPVGRFWLATAAMAAGDPLAAQDLELLRDISADYPHYDRIQLASPGLVRAISFRLARPPAPAAGISERGRQILQHAIDETRHDEKYLGGVSTARPTVTFILIALNIAMFIAEIDLGGATNESVLQTLGAAVPFLVRQGQYWRLVSANFLHFGVAHIAMNMFALLVIGPFVERSLGALRYTAIYFLTGIGAVGFVVAMNLWLNKDEALVGASGAIMGLIGATGAILLRGWLADRARVALRRLRLILIVVALQVVFDSLTPAVSGAAHLAGLIIGFLAALPVKARPADFDDDEPDRPVPQGFPVDTGRA